MTPTERLQLVAEQLRDNKPSPRISVRSFLSWFAVQRRGYYIVQDIRRTLNKVGLITVPDFEGVYIDSEIEFASQPNPPLNNAIASAAGVGTAKAVGEILSVQPLSVGAVPDIFLQGSYAEATYRIGKLSAANQLPLSVSPDATIEHVKTNMLLYDYSQLPVMQGEYEVKGVVSWQSIGSRLALGIAGRTAKDFMEKESGIVNATDSLFSAIPIIIARQYVLVRNSTRKIVGIVTASDLNGQFRQLAEPFLLIGEIENQLRRLIAGKFTIDEVKSACDPRDPNRPVATVDDLTFGEYVRLIEDPERWAKLGLSIDRGTVVRQLEDIRATRNDVMHFDPDPIAPEQLETLRRFVEFLRTLQDMGAA